MLPLLDTDVLIELEKRLPSALTWISSLPSVPPTSGFAAMELLNGCQNNADRRRVEKVLRPFPILWPSEEAMNHVVGTFTLLRLSSGVGMIDSLIGATALSHGLPLATFNVRHFSAIPDLVIVQPYEREFGRIETAFTSEEDAKRNWQQKVDDVFALEVEYRRQVEPSIRAFVQNFGGEDGGSFAYRYIMCVMDIYRACGQFDGVAQMRQGPELYAVGKYITAEINAKVAEYNQLVKDYKGNENL